MSDPGHPEAHALHEIASDIVPCLAPPDVFDPVIEAYKKDVDRTLIRENLKRTPHERAVRMQEAIECLARWQSELRRQRRENLQPRSTDGCEV